VIPFRLLDSTGGFYGLLSTIVSTFILWHVVPLLGNDHEISRYTTSVSR
jgi:hypothetical protein